MARRPAGDVMGRERRDWLELRASSTVLTCVSLCQFLDLAARSFEFLRGHALFELRTITFATVVATDDDDDDNDDDDDDNDDDVNDSTSAATG